MSEELKIMENFYKVAMDRAEKSEARCQQLEQALLAAKAALEEISNIDYTRSAVNFGCYDAVLKAKETLASISALNLGEKENPDRK